MAIQSNGPMVTAEGSTGGGEFSLHNGLEVASRSLGQHSRHGSCKIVVMTVALLTCDPGSILIKILPRLQQASIRLSCFALAAELHICWKATKETRGSM